jgi:serine/threonine protein kinase
MSVAVRLSEGVDEAPAPAKGVAIDASLREAPAVPSQECSTPSVTSPAAASEIREGDIIGGKYRIGRFLGAGAMGTVYAAHHALLAQDVAIKFLVPEALGHSDAIGRFVREARATATIKSEHVVRIFDVALRDGRTPYIVMEYLEGCDLSAWLRVRGRPEIEVAVDFILQACDAIAEAHELGIIHRDLKPANLFAVQRGGNAFSIKVLDFGISKAAGLVSSTAAPWAARPGAVITEEKIPIGSPCYMSPEQMESARDVDPRTDIWALGVTLCELATGRLPFEGQSLVQVYSVIQSGVPLHLREAAPHLPKGLEAVIHRCLSKERDKRYATVRDLATALAPFGSAEARTYAERMHRSSRSTPAERFDAPPPMQERPPRRDASRPDATLLSASSRPDPGVSRGRGRSTAAVLFFLGLLATLPLMWLRPEASVPAPLAIASIGASSAARAAAETPVEPAASPPRERLPPAPEPVLQTGHPVSTRPAGSPAGLPMSAAPPALSSPVSAPVSVPAGALAPRRAAPPAPALDAADSSALGRAGSLPVPAPSSSEWSPPDVQK